MVAVTRISVNAPRAPTPLTQVAGGVNVKSTAPVAPIARVTPSQVNSTQQRMISENTLFGVLAGSQKAALADQLLNVLGGKDNAGKATAGRANFDAPVEEDDLETLAARPDAAGQGEGVGARAPSTAPQSQAARTPQGSDKLAQGQPAERLASTGAAAPVDARAALATGTGNLDADLARAQAVSVAAALRDGNLSLAKGMENVSGDFAEMTKIQAGALMWGSQRAVDGLGGFWGPAKNKLLFALVAFGLVLAARLLF